MWFVRAAAEPITVRLPPKTCATLHRHRKRRSLPHPPRRNRGLQGRKPAAQRRRSHLLQRKDRISAPKQQTELHRLNEKSIGAFTRTRLLIAFASKLLLQ